MSPKKTPEEIQAELERERLREAHKQRILAQRESNPKTRSQSVGSLPEALHKEKKDAESEKKKVVTREENDGTPIVKDGRIVGYSDSGFDDGKTPTPDDNVFVPIAEDTKFSAPQPRAERLQTRHKRRNAVLDGNVSVHNLAGDSNSKDGKKV